MLVPVLKYAFWPLVVTIKMRRHLQVFMSAASSDPVLRQFCNCQSVEMYTSQSNLASFKKPNSVWVIKLKFKLTSDVMSNSLQGVCIYHFRSIRFWIVNRKSTLWRRYFFCFLFFQGHWATSKCVMTLMLVPGPIPSDDGESELRGSFLASLGLKPADRLLCSGVCRSQPRSCCPRSTGC